MCKLETDLLKQFVGTHARLRLPEIKRIRQAAFMFYQSLNDTANIQKKLRDQLLYVCIIILN